MTIDNFISYAFKNIQNVFPQALIQYQYDELVDTHYIKMSPPNVYNDNRFLDIGWEIKDKYNVEFETGDICFLTDNSLVQLTTPTRVLDLVQKVEFAIEIDRRNTIHVDFVEIGIELPQETKIDMDHFAFESCLSFAGNYQYAMAA